jgi:hypothetical protein
MEEVNFTEYKKQLIAAGISEENIYDFEKDRLKSFYQRYFDWCIDNLSDYSKTFGIEPSYFYYWDTQEINAEASLIRGKYIIRFSTAYMEVLHKKLGTKGQFIDRTDWTAFHNLQKVLPNSIEFLMFQASTIFTFYHEFAHLVQFKDRAFKRSEYPSNGNFTFENHLYEYDSDLNGCQFVSIYIQQFYNELLPEEYRSLNNYKRLMYLGISSIIITRLLFLNGQFFPYPPDIVDTSFYTKEKTHPHTYVRAKYMIEHYVRIAKANGVSIDFADTVSNITIICNEFFKDSDIFKNFINGMQDNFDEISKYIFELHAAQKHNTSCINHKINLFGFTTKTRR